MPTTYAIIKGNQYMDATLYTGSNAAATIINAGQFQPDLAWFKRRDATASNALNDSVRGVTKSLSSNLTDSEYTSTAGKDLTSFNSNGFSLGPVDVWSSYNASGASVVAWQWAAGQGTTSNNTSGTITSTVSANTTAGFSIVTYTGNGTLTGQTVGHGLGVTPGMIIVKARSEPNSWNTWHKSLSNPALSRIQLNLTNAADTTAAAWGNTAPTTSIFGVGWEVASVFTNKLNTTYVAYCWSEVPGFSQFGSYTGNGNADGPFIYTGFRPKFILFKPSSAVNSWIIYDTARNTYNFADKQLYPNLSDAEASGANIDIVSNGFKIRGSGTGVNENGTTYIYAAFAETPFKFANAR